MRFADPLGDFISVGLLCTFLVVVSTLGFEVREAVGVNSATTKQRVVEPIREREWKAEIKFCRTIYRRTANKRSSDLSAKAKQQARACQLAGWYSE